MTTAHQGHPHIIFLGGIFLPSQHCSILRHSQGVVQNAADALQKAFLSGFAEHVGSRVQLVNLPFIGSYPQTYKRITFPGCEDSLSPIIKARGEGFLNLRFLRFWSRLVSASRGLHRASNAIEAPVVVVYSAHLPFLAAARLMRIVRRDVFLCAILPDLPEFMGTGGQLYRTYKKIESFLFRRIVRGFESCVLLTDAMGDRIGIPTERRLVVEGIYDPHDEPQAFENICDHDGKFTILYTGTLATRYGIVDLLKAFENLDAPEARLWICGDGDARPLVESKAQHEPRLRYFGQVPRHRALAMQRAASVLVNPRRPEGEFTKYSFPSKTMEYLASGRQVIMHWLPGIPPEYREHLVIPATPDSVGLAQALRDVSAMTEYERAAHGNRAREFILAHKSPAKQAARILDHWAKLRGRASARPISCRPA